LVEHQVLGRSVDPNADAAEARCRVVAKCQYKGVREKLDLRS
jgi:hypothetical protein